MTGSVFVPVDLPDTLKSLSVLLVDDDDFMLDIVEELLQQLGIARVDRVHDGKEALALIESAVEPPQLLVCDLDMPGMDGIEIIRYLAEQHFDGGVILLSGADLRLLEAVGNLVRQHRLRFLGSLQKPIGRAQLVELLLKLAGIVARGRGGSESMLEPLSPTEIRAGLASGSVETFFQPKVMLTGRCVAGVECLLRWHHPQRGLVSPLAVIPVAEAHGLMDDVTMAVFARMTDLLGTWARQGHEVSVSVNISMENLKARDLPEALLGVALQAGVDPGRVTLELTESALIGDIATSLETITRLRLKGFCLSIDDFGTGYSSLEKLKQMPFTELKVDRAFVSGAAHDSVARTILESSVHLGHELGLRVVGEGAETQEDVQLLTTVGCDDVQGYVVAAPMPAEELIGWISAWEAGP